MSIEPIQPARITSDHSVAPVVQADRVVDGFISLLDEVDSESIAAEYGIGIHSKRIDFLEHVKIGIRLGIADPESLEDLSQQTKLYAQLEPISKGHFSKLTNGRPYEAIAELAIAILQHPSLYHPYGLVRRRIERATDRQIIGLDGTKLHLRNTLVVPESGDDEDDIHVPPEHGMKLHLGANLDPASKLPISLAVSSANTHDSLMFDSLLEATLEHHDLESFLLVFDRGYLNYERFRQLKADEIAFITPLKRNTLTTPVSRISDFHVHEEDHEPRRVIDEFIELSDTTETFRKVTVSVPDGDDHVYLTTLGPEEYDPLEIDLLYSVRWLIEIIIRELKQYTNVQCFHSKSLNGVLTELYLTLLAYILADYFRRRYPRRDGMAAALRYIRNFWNEPLGTYG